MKIVHVGELTRDRADQPRIVMFAHDGRGLGHLRRLSRIAAAVKNDFSILFMTGHRAASWLVPEECEFIHLPSLDSLDARRSRYWNRPPFWSEGATRGRLMRKAIIGSVIEHFQPNALILDYLPAGMEEEMHDVVASKSAAKCYFLLRGVLDAQHRVSERILNRNSRFLLEHCYDRIIVTADHRVVDVAAEYSFSPAMAAKTIYAGYVSESVSSQQKQAARARRQIPFGKKWVVCSGGSGKQAEDLIEACLKLAREECDIYFDIVVGPKSRIGTIQDTLYSDRVRIVMEDHSLPLLHAACDAVICRGGYNSLVEGMNGDARIIVVPIKGDWEQHAHAVRLAEFHPIVMSEALAELPDLLRRELTLPPTKNGARHLNMSGGETLRGILMADLVGTMRKPTDGCDELSLSAAGISADA